MIQNPGTYLGRPVNAVIGTAGTGTEQIAVKFELLDVPGEFLTWYGFFTEKSFEITIKALRSCGWTGSDLSEFEYGRPMPFGMNKDVELVVELQAGNDGLPRPKVVWVNAGGGMGMKNPMKAGEAQAFATRMRARILAFDQGQGSAPPSSPNPPARPNNTFSAPPRRYNPPPPRPQPPVGDDEIPFEGCQR